MDNLGRWCPVPTEKGWDERVIPRYGLSGSRPPDRWSGTVGSLAHQLAVASGWTPPPSAEQVEQQAFQAKVTAVALEKATRDAYDRTLGTEGWRQRYAARERAEAAYRCDPGAP